MPNPYSLTTVILTKNSVREIGELVQAAKRESEQVIVLDDYSEDGIERFAKEQEIFLLRHALENDFAAHRNSVFPSVTSEWVLFLDADELPTRGFWTELKQKIGENTYDAFFIKRQNRFLGKELRYGEAGGKLLVRAAKTRLGAGKWQRAVHEVWRVDSALTGTIQESVIHQQPESVAAFIGKLHRYAQLEQPVRPGLSASQCIFEVCVYPTGKFLWNLRAKQAWRDGFPGLALAWLMSYYSAIVRIQQYEKTI